VPCALAVSCPGTQTARIKMRVRVCVRDYGLLPPPPAPTCQVRQRPLLVLGGRVFSGAGSAMHRSAVGLLSFLNPPPLQPPGLFCSLLLGLKSQFSSLSLWRPARTIHRHAPSLCYYNATPFSHCVVVPPPAAPTNKTCVSGARGPQPADSPSTPPSPPFLVKIIIQHRARRHKTTHVPSNKNRCSPLRIT
jgi:hypothetical protein